MQLSSILASVFVSFAAAAAPTTRHFYTTNPSGEYAISNGYGPKVTVGMSIQNAVDGTIPLYRCRTTAGGADFLSFVTTSSNCEGAAGYVLEGAVTNIFASRQSGTYELRRLYNVKGDHELALYNPDNGAGPYGIFPCDTNAYAVEGILGYIYPALSNLPNTLNLYGFRKGCNSDHDTCCN